MAHALTTVSSCHMRLFYWIASFVSDTSKNIDAKEQPEKALRYLLKYCLLSLASVVIFSTPSLAGVEKRTKVFNTSNATKIYADVYRQTGQHPHPVALLLHMLGRSRSDYSALIAPLIDKGFSVVAMDFRGHGQSIAGTNRTRLNYEKFSDSDWALLPQDVKTVIQEVNNLPGLQGVPFAIVGASIGANTAIIAASENESVKALVLLSPGLDYHGLKPSIAMTKFKGKTLIVAAKDDGYSAQSSAQLARLKPQAAKLTLFDSGGHGTFMFSSHPELVNQIAVWLNENVPQ